MKHNSQWRELIKQDLLQAFFSRTDLINCPTHTRPITKGACRSIQERKEFSSHSLVGSENYRPSHCKDCEHNNEKENFSAIGLLKVGEN